MENSWPRLYSSCVRRIAIVGGGPTGIACAKYLLAEKAFEKIDIFEQRANVGGVWNLSQPVHSSRIQIPQTDPRYGTTDETGGLITSLELESPMYDYLETNIPKSLMAYSDTPFNDELPLFPGHADVLRYLEEYARPVEHLIHLNTQVTNLSPENSSDNCREPLKQTWEVTTKDLVTGHITRAQYDAAIVANGHYTVPHVPAVSGLADWHQRYPETVIHSKAYRRPEAFKDKKVLVIGNSASGLDIAAQLAPFARGPVYLASRSTSQLAPKGKSPTWRRDIAEIDEFLGPMSSRAIRTKDGEIFEGFEAVIFATGYFYSFPFLSDNKSRFNSSSVVDSPADSTTSLGSTYSLQGNIARSSGATSDPDSRDASLLRLVTSGLRTHDVYKHFLHMRYPTLAFPALNLKVIPFPLAENQAAVLARLWSGRLELPSYSSMRAWEKQEEERLFKAHRLRPMAKARLGQPCDSSATDDDSQDVVFEGGFHTLVYPEDANQINSLYDWAKSAVLRGDLENNGAGKLGARWDEEKVWLRGQFPDIKAAYAKSGENRREITHLGMLGEGWQNGFKHWQESTPRDDQRALFRKAAVPGW